MSTEPGLSDSDRALLSARADAFYAAMSRNQSPANWDQFLDGVPDRLRTAVLGELVIVDLVRRWQRNERPLLELYIDRFPELGPLDRVSGKLIAEEYRARLRAGDPRDIDQYRRRFPVQFPQIEDALLTIEQESNGRGKSGQFKPVGSIAAADTTGGRKTASGSIRGAESVRPSGVVSAAQRSRASEYAKVKLLGRGQFGEVWLVQSATTQIRKAMKVMFRTDDDTVRRELRSLDLIKNENSPYLLRTEDYWLDGDRLHVLMEVADCTLRNWLAEQNPGLESKEYTRGLPVGQLLKVMQESAEVMDELHDKQVLHRDIKPDNILLLNRHAKVADFGLARQQDAGVATQSMTAGSPAYMAPEVWSGRAGAASDLYSLAVTYAELRQGRLPVKLGSIAEIMIAHLNGQFEFNPNVFSREEIAVVRKALAENPQERYATCSEFVSELVRVVGVPLSLPEYKTKPPTGETQPLLQPIPPAPVDDHPTSSDVHVATDHYQPRRTVSTPTKTNVSVIRPPVKVRKTNWVGVVIALGVIVGLIGLIAFLLIGGPTTPTTTSEATPPTGETQDTKSTPTTKKDDGIVRPPETVFFPTGTTQEDGSAVELLADGRKAYRWVTATVGGEKMRFRLIPAGRPDGTRPFYLSELKVSNKAFGTPGPGGESAPAMNVTANRAAGFAAQHFKDAGGRLPTPSEWDHAAGLHDPTRSQATVTKAAGVPWVNQAKPSAARTPPGPSDVNHYDLLDMAGNGREWTCGVLKTPGTPPEVEVKLDGKFNETDLVILRGRNYTLEKELTFDQLRKEIEREPQTQFAGVPSPYTGFRVVLPVPEK